jgi:hypothetical protein
MLVYRNCLPGSSSGPLQNQPRKRSRSAIPVLSVQPAVMLNNSRSVVRFGAVIQILAIFRQRTRCPHQTAESARWSYGGPRTIQ